MTKPTRREPVSSLRESAPAAPPPDDPPHLLTGNPPGTLGNASPSTLLLASAFCHAFLLASTRIANTPRCSTTCFGTTTAAATAGAGGGGKSRSLAEVAAERAAEPAVVAAERAVAAQPLLALEAGSEGVADLAACLAL